MEELKIYNELPDIILAIAYDKLFGESDYSNSYKAKEMKDVFSGGLKPARSIWAYRNCLNYLDSMVI